MKSGSMTRSFSMLVMAASLAAFPVLLAARSAPQNDPGALAPPHNALLLGAAWYPEQWPESRWEEDLRLMEAAHITFLFPTRPAWEMTVEVFTSDAWRGEAAATTPYSATMFAAAAAAAPLHPDSSQDRSSSSRGDSRRTKRSRARSC